LDDVAPAHTTRTRRTRRTTGTRRAPTRRSEEERLALVADYNQAASQWQGQSWLKQQGLNVGQIIGYRKLKATSQLPPGDPRLATVPDFLSRDQKASLVREYLEAVSQGGGEAWLTERNLTKMRMTRWQSMLRSTMVQSTQPQAPQPTVPGGSGAGTETFVDPDSYFGAMLFDAAAQGASGSASSHLPQIDPALGEEFTLDDLAPGEAFPLDDVAPTHVRPVQRTAEEKLALLADYDQAASRGQGRSWLTQHGLNYGQMSSYRKLKATSQLPAGDPRLAAASGRSLSSEQKSALVRDYLEALSRGEGATWLTEHKQTKVRMTRWMPAAVDQGASGSSAGGLPGPGGIDRAREQKLTLVAEYEQAISRMQGKAWLDAHGLTASTIYKWRKLRTTDHSGR
jgi:hypothetical protein